MRADVALDNDLMEQREDPTKVATLSPVVPTIFRARSSFMVADGLPNLLRIMEKQKLWTEDTGLLPRERAAVQPGSNEGSLATLQRKESIPMRNLCVH